MNPEKAGAAAGVAAAASSAARAAFPLFPLAGAGACCKITYEHILRYENMAFAEGQANRDEKTVSDTRYNT